MKKPFEAAKKLPAGYDWENLRFGLKMGHGLSFLSLLAFLNRYSNARGALYERVQGLDGRLVTQLVPGRIIIPFPELMAGLPLWGLWLYLAAMLVQVGRHYAWHTRGSMSIYLMKRLPDRWELHRRCWTVPVLAALMELVLFAVMTGLCWLLYRFATPEGCLPI